VSLGKLKALPSRVEQNIKTDDNHPSIKAIKENKTESDQFIFNPINEEFVIKEINKIGIKKATGKDGISSQIKKYENVSQRIRQFNCLLRFQRFWISWEGY
jgi:hypothetical protein